MEAAALSIRLMSGVMLLITAAPTDVAFPRVVPDKLQFFEYDNVSIYCDELGGDEWRVMRKIRDAASIAYSRWDTSASSCVAKPAFHRHSGEYWCENERGDRSDAVSITVTGGSVVLESPARPVMEGTSVTLRCRRRKNASVSISDFYKDGSQVKTGYRGEMTITNVSLRHDGLYKCNISGAAESALSRLSVKGDASASSLDVNSQHSLSPGFLVWVVVGVLLAALLLLVMGVVYFLKAKDKSKPASQAHKDEGAPQENSADDVTYAAVRTRRTDRERELRAGPASHTEDKLIYSLISF